MKIPKQAPVFFSSLTAFNLSPMPSLDEMIIFSTTQTSLLVGLIVVLLVIGVYLEITLRGLQRRNDPPSIT